MKTRRGISYPNQNSMSSDKRKGCCDFICHNPIQTKFWKKAKSSAGMPMATVSGQSDFLDTLPDDIVLLILAKLSSTASCPSDFISVLLTCKRLNALGVHSLVLSKASPKAFAVNPENWSESAHRILKQCSDAGNVEACYTLGMVNIIFS